MSTVSKYILCCLLLLAITCVSQNENKKWCFGTSAGLDFMTNPPTPFSAPGINAPEGCASIADAAGTLLFYTDGTSIWNPLHVPMANGTGILGGGGSQGVLIVRQPGNSSLYYVFTANNTALRYSIVDMSLAAGMGSVTTKNATLTTIPQAYKVAGTRHCNAIDFWIVSQDQGTTTTRAYLLDATGLNTTAVLSTGPFIHHTFGTLKFSSEGNKLASTDYGSTIQLYDFNIVSGMITSAIQFGNITGPAWGIEFSLDGTKLYGTQQGSSQVLQWDICSGPPNVVTANQYTVNNAGSSKGALLLGMDRKIYIARPSTQALAVINNPDAAGAACNYVEAGQSLAPQSSQNGLPNLIKRRYNEPSLTYTISPTACQTVSFTSILFPNGILTCMSQTPVPGWNFGDPGSGSNTSGQLNPVHVYSSPGTYTAMLILSYNCGTDTVKQVINLTSLSPTLSVSGSSTLCEGQSTTLTVSGASSYTWSGPAGAAGNSPVLVVPSSNPGSFVYTVTGLGSGVCAGKLTTTVDVSPKPVLTLSGSTVICNAGAATLTAGGASSYTWSTGSSLPTVTLNAGTGYLVSGENANGCIATKTVQILFQISPDISVSNATTCAGVSTSLVATSNMPGLITYTWFPDGTNGTIITVSPSATTNYSVTGSVNGCKSEAVGIVVVGDLQQPQTGFYYVAPVCMTQSSVSPSRNNQFSQGGSFLSSPGIALDPASGLIDPSASEPGTYTITYALDQAGCIAAGSHAAEVTILPSPQLHLTPAIKVAPGGTATLSVSGGMSYSWGPSSDLSCQDCVNPVVTPTESKAYCVLETSSACKAVACVSVEVTCDTGFDFSAPNAFTPDGNGNNDAFCLQGWNACIKSFEVLVFNRWGENVFRSNDPGFCWDGIYKGKLLEAEVFVYQIKAIYRDNTVVNKRGNIHLIR